VSFIFVAAAGASAIISKEVTTWMDRMKQKRRTGSMGLFTKDDLVRNVAGDVGMVPVAGAFAEKAINDAAFSEYSDGSKRNTGTWAGAGIDAGMDIIKLAPVVGAYAGSVTPAIEAGVEAAAPVIEGTVQAAAPAADAALQGAGPILDTTLEASTKSASPFLDAISAGKVAEAASEAVDQSGTFIGKAWDAGGDLLDGAKGFVDQGRGYVQNAFVDSIGQELGKSAYMLTENTMLGAAQGAIANPEAPGRGAAGGAFSGAVGGVANIGVDALGSSLNPGLETLPSGDGQWGPGAGPNAQSPQGEWNVGAFQKPIGTAARALVTPANSAIQNALTPQTPAQTYLKNPYGNMGSLWNSPYALHNRRGSI
jgi:hypothetical protein